MLHNTIWERTEAKMKWKKKKKITSGKNNKALTESL